MKLSVYMTLYTLTHVVLLIYEAKVSPACHCLGLPPRAFSGLPYLFASPSPHGALPGSLSPTLISRLPICFSKCIPPLFPVSE